MKKVSRQLVLPSVLFLLSLLFAGLATVSRGAGNSPAAVRKVQRAVQGRLALLDRYCARAVEGKSGEWINVSSLPEDMVIYRYEDDTLQSWANRFSTANDALSSGVLFQSLVNPRTGFHSPLSDIKEEYSYCNIGPKWYLARTFTDGGTKLVAGLEVVNANSDRSFSGINPRLRVPEGFSIQELSATGGEVVSVNGSPMFKLLVESLSDASLLDLPLFWAALFMLITAGFCFLYARPSVGNLALVLSVILITVAWMYFAGMQPGTGYGLFSPLLYADGRVFYSLGGLFLISLLLILPAWSLLLVRKQLYARLGRGLPRILGSVVLLLYALVVLVFSYLVIRSITLNSNINLEIYKIKDFTWVSAMVYAMLIALISCIPVLLHILFRKSSFSIPVRVAFSVLVAAYLVSLTAVLGFRKEKARLEVWANRLAVTRDIPLEMQLRNAEGKIATDPVLASLSVLDNAESVIRNRIADNYLSRVAQEYDLSVSVGQTPDMSFFKDSEAVSPDSRFAFKEGSDGLAGYAAVFQYHVGSYGTTSILLKVEQKGDWRYRGYASILGEASPGEVLIPSSYSYARYQGLSLVTYRGNFAYPVRMDYGLAGNVYAGGDSSLRLGGYTHFVYVVADAEAVIVSRRTINALYYAVSALFIALVAFLGLSLPAERGRRNERLLGRSYFSTRLTWVIMISLTLTLVSMAAVSVYFVYERNEQNRRTLMTEKINSISASISARIRGARSTSDLRNAETLSVIEGVGNNTNSDVTLYDPKGMVMMTTAPAMFERNVVDSRIEPEAYRNIMLLYSRYYIQKEKVGRKRFFSMYAPLTGDGGDIIAIICAPYTDDSYEFEVNAVNQSIMILSLFILLMLAASFMARRVLERMFSPLLQLGRKMEGANLDSLEYIQYDKQDEITSLVVAYNRMVSDLSESSRQLAEAERDKAWSGMARQVAHEIKNPLTPMKLQIQRLVRLKAKGDPSWQEKFDEVSSVLLDHIDMLTDTANEFSTFAKLYTEEPAEFDLDQLLQEEISMFSGREDIHFDYFGLSGAVVSGPKPQLTRVFVNLINNAVQAIDGVKGATVRVSLRNSGTEGYYDIVFEDNGPGVSEENVGRLFTPNFTTKSAGSGLGLAISRSILQKCEAQISYSRSFVLGGACFTIMYPKRIISASDKPALDSL